MLKQCENCWVTYDTERSNEYFCPKCLGTEIAVKNEWEVENGMEG